MTVRESRFIHFILCHTLFLLFLSFSPFPVIHPSAQTSFPLFIFGVNLSFLFTFYALDVSFLSSFRVEGDRSHLSPFIFYLPLHSHTSWSMKLNCEWRTKNDHHDDDDDETGRKVVCVWKGHQSERRKLLCLLYPFPIYKYMKKQKYRQKYIFFPPFTSLNTSYSPFLCVSLIFLYISNDEREGKEGEQSLILDPLYVLREPSSFPASLSITLIKNQEERKERGKFLISDEK